MPRGPQRPPRYEIKGRRPTGAALPARPEGRRTPGSSPADPLRPLQRRIPEVPPERLRWTCDPRRYKLSAVTKGRIDIGTVGQDRAIHALQMGTSIAGPGFNVFVCGPPGTGRTSAVKAVLRDSKPTWSKRRDYCYVHNFKDPDRPQVLTFPPASGKLFKKRMELLVNQLKKRIPALFEHDEYTKERARILERFHKAERKIFDQLDRKARKMGFMLGQYQEQGGTRQELFPVLEGRPLNMAQLNDLACGGQLTMADVNSINERYVRLQPDMVTALKKRQNLYRQTLKALNEAEKKVVKPLLEREIRQAKRAFPQAPVEKYLEDVGKSLLEELHLFKDQEEELEEQPPHQDGEAPVDPKPTPDDSFLKYRVNVVLDNSERADHPVVLEASPSHTRLFGTIERIERGGMWYGDFMGIKGGSFLRADGGYLILNCTDILSEPHVWLTLKRTLKNRQLEIQVPESNFQPATQTIKPEPIDVRLKVVMIGLPENYEVLAELDEDFEKIFKIKAEFDSEMELNHINLGHFTHVVMKIILEEGLRRPDTAALAALAEHAVRLAGRQGKLTTQFSEIADVLRESSYWAIQEGARGLRKKHIARTIEERMKRLNLTEVKLRELIESGILLIDTQGRRAGQVNGLWVYETGTYSFGLPTRITASSTPGIDGVVNIEREVNLSGASHSKGMLILGGYLRHRYARNIPLSLSASICFEQSYSGVDGDSAALAEILSLLSDLSQVPLRQDIAVTGSINQKGESQAVGGINEKIEGFFHVCDRKGLTGRQGVIIPAANVDDLMLDTQLVDAVKRGMFHVFPVHNVDEALEILTGKQAGAEDDKGAFPGLSVNSLAQARLEDLSTVMRKFRSPVT